MMEGFNGLMGTKFEETIPYFKRGCKLCADVFSDLDDEVIRDSCLMSLASMFLHALPEELIQKFCDGYLELRNEVEAEVKKNECV